jgi:hypothetical protein
MTKTRKDKRDEAAEKVCRELRYQIARYGVIGDWDAIMKQLRPWLKYSKKNRYDRP